MQVIKLGGSLEKSNKLTQCLETIHKMPSNLVIVAGGGVFADQVRQTQKKWHFNETIAHEMAILAMQQMALLFKGLQPTFQCLESVAAIKSQVGQQPIIWLPKIQELNQAGLGANWNITSDSLAAWLSMTIQASHLTLIKSTPAADKLDSITEWVKNEVVDSEFSAFTKKARFNIQIMSAEKFCSSVC